jgi:molybdopterin converting factor small subunit
MKIRAGFVSNSSSSSFIIKTKEDYKKLELNITVDLTKYFDLTKVSTIKQLQDAYIKKYFYKNLEDFYSFAGVSELEKFEKMSKEIEDGKNIYIGKIEYEDFLYSYLNNSNSAEFEIEVED